MEKWERVDEYLWAFGVARNKPCLELHQGLRLTLVCKVEDLRGIYKRWELELLLAVVVVRSGTRFRLGMEVRRPNAVLLFRGYSASCVYKALVYQPYLLLFLCRRSKCHIKRSWHVLGTKVAGLITSSSSHAISAVSQKG